jgi:hypothetical protein
VKLFFRASCALRDHTLLQNCKNILQKYLLYDTVFTTEYCYHSFIPSEYALTLITMEVFTMENIKKRPWWAFVILFCLCGVSCLAREFGEGVMLPPTSFFGIWHLFVLPVLGTVVLVAANRLGGKYDFVLLLAFELLTLAWMFVPEIIRAGGFFTPFELPIWFVVTVVSIPAIAAFILSGITYLITKMAARKKSA